MGFESAGSPQVTEQAEVLQPLGVFILKVAQPCNLACPGCYEYEGPDQSWRSQPNYMNEAVVQATARRVGEHAAQHGLDSIKVVYHGGEPTLAHRVNPNFYPRATQAFRDAMPKRTRATFGMQTNSTLLDRPILDLFRELGIRIGVSLDGVKSVNDALRPYKNGQGSYEHAVRGIRLLQHEYPDLFASILCRVDPESNLLQTYNSFKAFNPPAVEFILPHGNWTSPPPGYENYARRQTALPHANWLLPTKYARQLLPVFKAWYKDPAAPRIPLFEEIICVGVGGPGSLEYIGPFVPDAITVRPDGSIADVDTMSTTVDGRLDLGLNVFNDSFDAALRHPSVRARRMGKAALSQTCLDCSFVNICEGGYFPHRYQAGSNPDEPNKELAEFLNPSVYCGDLTAVIGGVMNQLGGLAAVGKTRPPKPVDPAEIEFRHILQRAQDGHITPQTAVEQAAAHGYVAIPSCMPHEGYEPCVPLTSTSFKNGKFELQEGFKAMVDGKVSLVRAGTVGSTAVWGTLSGDVVKPNQRMQYGQHIFEDAKDGQYYRGLFAWQYNPATGLYDLFAHPDVMPVLQRRSPAAKVGAIEFVKDDGSFNIAIPGEPGHVGSPNRHEVVGSLPVRMAAVLLELPNASTKYLDYKPLQSTSVA